MPGTSTGLRVLLVEDDRAQAAELVEGLGRHGMVVTHVPTGREALRSAQAQDFVLLDLGLPDLEGLEVCRRLRADSTIPIIVLSGRAEEFERVEALQGGADGYLVKPAGLRELVAHINAVWRRSSVQARLSLRVAGLRLDRRGHQVTLDGVPLRLASKEFDLLALLMEEQDRVVPRPRIYREVWGGEHVSDRTLNVYVATLRGKLGDPTWIQTVRGVGLRLRAPNLAGSGSTPVKKTWNTPG